MSEDDDWDYYSKPSHAHYGMLAIVVTIAGVIVGAAMYFTR